MSKRPIGFLLPETCEGCIHYERNECWADTPSLANDGLMGCFTSLDDEHVLPGSRQLVRIHCAAWEERDD